MAATLERTQGAVNRIVSKRTLQLADGSQNGPGLAPASAAQLCHDEVGGKAQRERLGIPAQPALIGAGEPGFGPQRNYLAERAANLLVEILYRGVLGAVPPSFATV